MQHWIKKVLAVKKYKTEVQNTSPIRILFVKKLTIDKAPYIFTCFLNKEDSECHGALENLLFRKKYMLIDTILPVSVALDDTF